MRRYTALLDANVLYPAPLRDLLLQLAVSDIYHAKWSADIHREWIEALLRHEPHRGRAALERTRNLMDAHVRDGLVVDYEALVPSLLLPDPDDRHVLAAAIVGRCDAIVTRNLKDFPAALLKPFSIEALHPDEFLSIHLSRTPELFCAAIRKIRARLKSPTYSAEQYLAILSGQGLVATASDLKAHCELI